jgi:hypothetical protein
MWEVQMTQKTLSSVQIKLESLRKIEIISSSSLEVFEKILKPNSLREIKISGAECEYYKKFTETDYRSISRILSKQGKFVSLELTGISIIDFPESPDWSWENLQKLVLDRVEFPTPENFKNFAGFLKKLEKLTGLSLRVRKEKTDRTYLAALANLNLFGQERDESDEELTDDEKERKFVEMLTELFSLPNLMKLKFEFCLDNQVGSLANVKLENRGVQELTLEKIPVERDNKYSQFMKMFPNVRKAKLEFVFPHGQITPDLAPIKSWTSLKELELNHVIDNTLRQIKNLRSLKIYKFCDTSAGSWTDFCQNNRQLERLEIIEDEFCFKNLKVVAAHLPNLKVLSLETISLGKR